YTNNKYTDRKKIKIHYANPNISRNLLSEGGRAGCKATTGYVNCGGAIVCGAGGATGTGEAEGEEVVPC
ncbi:MAG: hypothetical protein QOJ70_1908, partial [Acidobacteriota bacterium]|nr:hypothetical protein [Acidobacteriota bacterium]